MIAPLPQSNEPEHDRFKHFAKAILSVPRTEIETPEQAIFRLEAEKKKIEGKIAEIKREKARRKTNADSVGP